MMLVRPLFLIGVLALLLITLDQIILTRKIPETSLRYSLFTSQKSQSTGFVEPGCKAVAYRLTWLSQRRLSDTSASIAEHTSWRKGAGSLKLPTWGCGLAYYDHGGKVGQRGRMYYWGEGLNHQTNWLFSDNIHCADLAFLLIRQGRILCVSGAEAPLNLLAVKP